MRSTARARSRRHRLAALAGTLAAVLVVAGCTSSTGGTAITVTSDTTVSGTSGASGTTTGAGTSSSSGSSSDQSSASSSSSSGSGTSSGTPAESSSTGATSSAPDGGGKAYGTPAGTVVKTEPDGFKITKLKPGQQAPQFIVYSFDGVGWDEKWQYWFGVGQDVPFHFTGFLSGPYMLTTANKDLYTGPGHLPGQSDIGFGDPGSVPTEINNLNKALGQGDEIGTHFNGHFCGTEGNDVQNWNTADWNNELDQFFSLVKNVDANNHLTDKLNLAASEIKGERTPCLGGTKDDLYPALESHGLTYDSTFGENGRGLAWPTKSTDGKIWEMGMVEFPLHGSGKPVITMDYNFYYQQEPAAANSGTNPPAAQSAKDGAVVLATYEDMYKGATTDGVNEPIILGNHFEEWNNNAYTQALHSFALEECGKTNTYCVPFRDVIDWMQAQDPAVLASLQNHKSNLGGCPYTAWPNCAGKIQY